MRKITSDSTATIHRYRTQSVALLLIEQWQKEAHRRKWKREEMFE